MVIVMMKHQVSALVALRALEMFVNKESTVKEFHSMEECYGKGL